MSALTLAIVGEADGSVTYVERLNKLRTRAKAVGADVEDELNALWHAAEFYEQME
jgi:hypothetical protein